MRSCARLIAGIVLLVSMAVAHGAPWLAAGDARARQAVTLLADRGCLDGPVTTWPLTLPSLSAEGSSPACREALAMLGDDGTDGLRAGVRLAGTSDVPLFRHFRDEPRERIEVGGWIEAGDDAWSGRLALTAVDPFDGAEELRLDGSWLAASPGNWILGAGAVDRWWGPGWYSTLGLSSSARPVPGVWLARNRATASGLPLLEWLGPWHLSLFAGQLESDRAVPHARLLAARFAFRPWRPLEVGLTRMAQWGGEGRPEDVDSFWNLVIGRDNGDTSGLAEDEEPGNQLAGIDFRLGLERRGWTLGFYGQLMGEDEAGMLPAKHSILAGVDAATAWGRGSQRWVLEATNTLAGGWFGEDRPGTTYEHSTYASGFRYRGRALASTWDGDARAITLGVHQFFAGGAEAWLSFTDLELNSASVSRNSTSSPAPPLLALTEARQTGLWEAGWGFPVLGGTGTLAATCLTSPIGTAETTFDRFRWTAAWEYRLR